MKQEKLLFFNSLVVIEIEIQDNSELLTPDVVRKRVEEKVRNNEIIELSKGWLLVKML